MDDPTDPTARGSAQTIRGIVKQVDAGSAETALAPSTPGPQQTSRPTVKLRDTGEIPAQVTERYKLDKVLGHGGMGEVLLAHDDTIGREVAVKRIRTASPSAEELSRFVREARVQGRLEHPAIVPVHDLVFDPVGKPFFVMKRLAGTDMHERLKKLRAGDVEDVAAERRALLRAFVDVCNATHFAHEKKIIHRDLKPANVMLGDYGEVYILDWGVAHAADAEDDIAAPSGRHDLGLASGETQQGAVLGTPAYMAPEQLVGDKVAPAADIYSLGCILYEICAGEPLHARNRAVGAAFNVTATHGLPSEKRADVPPELDRICQKAVRPDPAERWQSARSLGDAVQGFLDGDRDVAVRKELAQHHLASARAGLERAGDEARREAMRAAGRALALDPTSVEAADLVTRLMLEPPEEVPAEVEQHLEEMDTETARSHGKVAALSVLGYLAFVPLLLWSGVRDVTFVIAFAALSLISAGQVMLMLRNEKITAAPLYLNAAINALLIGVVCRMTGPFIIAPALVLVTLMAYASHPRFGKIPILAGILSASVLVPWGLELLGVLEKTYAFDGGTLTLSSSVVQFSSVPVQLAMAAVLVSLIGVVAVLTRGLAMRQRDAARKVELHAWQLRQIVPVSPR
jgi:hypothetical protein